MPDVQQVQESKDQQDGKEFIPKSAYEEVTSDLMKHKAKARELEEKLKSYEAEREASKIKTLKEQEQWKQIAEEKERQAEALAKKLEQSQALTQNYFKYSEVKTHALKAGIKDTALKDLELLPLDELQVEVSSTGQINVLGADKFIEKQKMERPHWFGRGAAAQVDSTQPGVNSSAPVTAKDLLRLQKEGKQGEYEAALLRMSKQRRG